MLTFLLFACTSSPPESKPEKKEEGNTLTIAHQSDVTTYSFRKEKTRIAEKVACADLNNDGIDEQIHIHDGSIFWGQNQDPLEGVFQVSQRGKNSAGRETFLFATGYGKGARDAKSILYSLDSSGLKKLWEKDGSRNQVTAIDTQDGSIFFTSFAEETMVQGGWLKETFEVKSEIKMAMAQAPLDQETIVIGRMYGDQPRSFGDLRIKKGSKETFLPAFRGIKSVLVHDVNQDGISDILVSDGWHYQYASQAKGRIRAYMGPDYEDIRTLANFDQDYTVNHIEPHRNGRDYLVQAASHVYLLQQTPYGFKSTEVSRILETGSAVFCYNKEKTAILISGQPSQLFHLEPMP